MFLMKTCASRDLATNYLSSSREVCPMIVAQMRICRQGFRFIRIALNWLLGALPAGGACEALAEWGLQLRNATASHQPLAESCSKVKNVLSIFFVI